MTGTRLLGVFRLFRFELPFSAGVCVILGQFLALDSIPPLQEIVLGFLSIFFISATALILNDYFDLEIDKINAPHRPLPSGMVTTRDAIVLSFVVAFLGLMAGALLSLTALITIFVVWVVGVLYNWRFKRSGLVGNLMVSFSVGMTFVFGGISVGQPANINVWWFGAIAFLMDLGEEIAADAMDIEGDKLIGSRSLAIVYGRETALTNQRRGIWRTDSGQSGAICLGENPFDLSHSDHDHGHRDPVFDRAFAEPNDQESPSANPRDLSRWTCCGVAVHCASRHRRMGGCRLSDDGSDGRGSGWAR